MSFLKIKDRSAEGKLPLNLLGGGKDQVSINMVVGAVHLAPAEGEAPLPTF